MRTKKVVVLPYNPEWKEAFSKIADELSKAVESLALRIEHVGSTSVEGMSAKPIIDIDLVIKSEAEFSAVRTALESIGYQHEGDLGIIGREAFKYTDKPHLMEHHLYVCAEDSEELRRHLTFRDYLRNHPEAILAYSKVKEEAAKLFPEDIDGYIRYKSGVIEELYAVCGLI